jgi:outer membrane protein OmpA-like peptidoglycan-associated protein
MAEDWSLDVRKYVPDADQGVIDAIVRHCGIALQKRDSSLVSFTEKSELDRVRENFLKKKLGLTAPDSELDAAIAAVGERMKDDHSKNRVTVYYLLAQRFRKLSVFGGRDGLAAAPAAVSAADMGVTAATVEPTADRYPERPAVAPAPRAQPVAQAFSARPAAGAAEAATPPATGGLTRWLPWLILGLALLALLWWLFAGRQAPRPVATTQIAPPAAATAPAMTAPTPGGSVAGFPAKVFFANDSAAIPADGGQVIQDAAAALKTDGGKVAITAYTDRTGDLAHNQELAKNRAVAVRDALVSAGVPLANIEMRPPAMVETGATNTMDADARRVEISRG